MRKRLAMVLALMGAMLVSGTTAAFAASTAAAMPLSTSTSYYMNTVDASTLTSLGCAAGARTVGQSDPQDDLIILDLGAPEARGSQEGTMLYRAAAAPGGGFASTSEIESGAEAFATGYLNCANPNASLSLVLGTSNWGSQVTKEHGAAWGGMVNDIAASFQSAQFANRISVYGGSDIETAWSSPTVARAWVDGYLSANTPTLLNFGDAGGCPTTDNGTGRCSNGWTQDDVWYVSWGSGGRQPIPQIYNAAQAKQWYEIERYSLTKTQAGYQPMVIAGVLTMAGDCQQSAGCGAGFDFTPEQGYQHLSDLLNANPETAQALPYSTDIKKAWLS